MPTRCPKPDQAATHALARRIVLGPGYAVAGADLLRRQALGQAIDDLQSDRIVGEQPAGRGQQRFVGVAVLRVEQRLGGVDIAQRPLDLFLKLRIARINATIYVMIKPQSFIPIAGGLIGGSDSKSKTLTVTLADNKVIGYTYSGGGDNVKQAAPN